MFHSIGTKASFWALFALLCTLNHRVILNPKLKNKTTRTTIFFEGCLRFGHLFVSVNHHRGSHLKDGVYVVDGKVMKDFGYEMAPFAQGFNWVSSPTAIELENTIMDWLGQVLKLPKAFLFSCSGGVLLGTTSEAILVTLVAARDKVLSQIGRENICKLVVYVSNQTHCSVQKATHIIGIHHKNIRVVKTMKSTSFTLLPESLLFAIHTDVQNGLVPCYLCATLGTTSTTTVDPLGPLCKVAKEYDMWVHVDVAYAGSACICPEFRHLIDGVEGANSFSFNAYKWLLTNLDCCCLWLKDPTFVIKSLSTNSPAYDPTLIVPSALTSTGKTAAKAQALHHVPSTTLLVQHQLQIHEIY
ncbi:Tyrosine/DOPA decarboxylase 5 [Glycine soja]